MTGISPFLSLGCCSLPLGTQRRSHTLVQLLHFNFHIFMGAMGVALRFYSLDDLGEVCVFERVFSGPQRHSYSNSNFARSNLNMKYNHI